MIFFSINTFFNAKVCANCKHHKKSVLYYEYYFVV